MGELLIAARPIELVRPGDGDWHFQADLEARGGSLLRVDSPFFPTIVLFENGPFSWVSGGFLERRIPGKNGEGSTRSLCEPASPCTSRVPFRT